MLLHMFETGAVKVLVATTILEEGTNIPRCNLVINYNHVGNEITRVQTRGKLSFRKK